MSLIGYAFAARFASLVGYMEKASWVVGCTVFFAGYILWRRTKKHIGPQTKSREDAALGTR